MTTDQVQTIVAGMVSAAGALGIREIVINVLTDGKQKKKDLLEKVAELEAELEAKRDKLQALQIDVAGKNEAIYWLKKWIEGADLVEEFKKMVDDE
jgi:predicted nuclease with TOPRIM domain